MELTNTLNYVVPVMLAVLVAKTIADGLEKKGIYDLVIDLNQLPYLDSKHEYLWDQRRVVDLADPDVPTLRADKAHTVRSLTGRLLELARKGMGDTGFPVLIKEGTDRIRVVGFLGMNELEHALCASPSPSSSMKCADSSAELADQPDAQLDLMPTDRSTHPRTSMYSVFSFGESFSDPRHDPYDLSHYIDRVSLAKPPNARTSC